MIQESIESILSADQLVARLGIKKDRFKAYQRLLELSDEALPAIRKGLRDDQIQIRKWCAMILDQIADEDALMDLIPLLTDPHPAVRLWAVHSISCDHCKEDVTCDVDLVPMLIERVQKDHNIRVRRMALIMMTTEFSDNRTIPIHYEILEKETDKKLVAHAHKGIERLKDKGILIRF